VYILVRKNQSAQGKTCCSATMFTTNPIWTPLGVRRCWDNGNIAWATAQPVMVCVGNFGYNIHGIYGIHICGKVLQVFGHVHLEIGKTQNFPQYLRCRMWNSKGSCWHNQILRYSICCCISSLLIFSFFLYLYHTDHYKMIMDISYIKIFFVLLIGFCEHMYVYVCMKWH
jgi:hypothetical protein